MSASGPPRPGKRRGLEATSTAQHHFAILALDHIGSMAETMRPDDPGRVTRAQIVAAKVEIARRLHGLASALLLDPLTGFADGLLPHLGSGTGLLLGLEDSDYGALESEPRVVDGWSVERAAAAGADAVKISFRFDPAGDVRSVERFVREVVAECERHDLPLFAEPLGAFRTAADRRRVIVEAARRFSNLGVDVLKVEFPEDPGAISDRGRWAEACAQLNAAAGVPWTLLSAGDDFARFHAMLEVACDAGASGFVAGRTVWREALVAADGADAWRQAAERLGRLARTARERGRPWSASAQPARPRPAGGVGS